MQRLSTTSVPFTVLGMCHNPSNEDFLVVCGLKDCHMLKINSSGQVIRRSTLHPSVDANGYIVKTFWSSGRITDMILVTDTFVKIYDTRIDVLCPSFYFVSIHGKIKDATCAVTDEVLCVEHRYY